MVAPVAAAAAGSSMTPLVGASLAGGLSLLGGIFGNQAISKQAAAQFNANTLFIERDKSVVNNQIALSARDVNAELGAALANLGYQAATASGQVATTQAERNVYGNSARRQQIAVDMQKALAADSLAQAADAKMTDVQTQFSNIAYQAEAKNIQNAQAYNQAMSQQQSTFDILSGAAMSGFSAYSTGLGIESATNTIAMQKVALDKTTAETASLLGSTNRNTFGTTNYWKGV